MSHFNYRIAFFGPPGIGKGTQAALLADKYNLIKISGGDILRAEKASNSILGQFISNNWSLKTLESLVLELMDEKVLQAEAEGRGFVAESFSELHTAITFSNFLEKIGSGIDYVFSLDFPDTEASYQALCTRMSKRWVHPASGRIYNENSNPPHRFGVDDITGEPLEQRLDDQASVIARIQFWASKSSDLRNFFVNKGIIHSINGLQPFNEVFKQIQNILEDPERIKLTMERRKQLVLNLSYNRLKPLDDPRYEPIATSVSEKDSCIIIQTLMNTMILSSNKARFPGTLTNGFTQDAKEKLASQPYSVAYKLDGIRFILCVHNSQCYLLGRKLEVLKLKISDSTLDQFDGSFFDGELMEVGGQFVYFIFDVISVGKQVVMKLPFSPRLAKAAKFVEFINSVCSGAKAEIDKELETHNKIARNIYEILDEGESLPSPSNIVEELKTIPLSFRIQEFHPVNQTRYLFENVQNFSFPTDGIVFMPERDYYTRNKLNDNILKWKPALENCIDVTIRVIQKDPPLAELLVAHYNEGQAELVYFCREDGKPQTSSDPALLERDGMIVECSWNPEQQAWKFFRDRKDKLQPNVDWVANKLWKSLQTPVSKEDLLNFTDLIPTTQPTSFSDRRGGRGRGTGRGMPGRDGGREGGRGLSSSNTWKTGESDKSSNWRRPMDAPVSPRSDLSASSPRTSNPTSPRSQNTSLRNSNPPQSPTEGNYKSSLRNSNPGGSRNSNSSNNTSAPIIPRGNSAGTLLSRSNPPEGSFSFSNRPSNPTSPRNPPNLNLKNSNPPETPTRTSNPASPRNTDPASPSLRASSGGPRQSSNPTSPRSQRTSNPPVYRVHNPNPNPISDISEETINEDIPAEDSALDNTDAGWTSNTRNKASRGGRRGGRNAF